MNGIHFGLINLIKSVMMKKWRITLEVNTSEGKEKIGPIKVTKGFSRRLLLWKIVYSYTESNRMVLEKHRGVQFISRSQPKDHASVVCTRSQNIPQV